MVEHGGQQEGLEQHQTTVPLAEASQIATLTHMGFDMDRLKFYRWLANQPNTIPNPVGQAEVYAAQGQAEAQSTVRVSVTSVNISPLLR